jgi:hypothetical protein
MDYRKPADASSATLHQEFGNNFITESDLYKELWHGRDIEISNLWQRSLFLGAFLILSYTGYGTLWYSQLQQDKDILSTLLSASPTAIFLSIGFLMLSGFGLIISILWIQMAKGSKRWYERYEKSICLIIDDPDLENRVFSFPHQPEGKKGVPMHGYLEEADCDDSLFSTSAGYYSVSRVNIAIGQVAMVIWRLLFILHTLYFFIQILSGNPIQALSRTPWMNITIFIVGVIVCILGIIPLIKICLYKTKSNS